MTKEQLIDKINDLRDVDMLLDWADVPRSEHGLYEKIWQRAKLRSKIITEQLFPDAIPEDELIRINGILMCYLSQLWWEFVDAAIDKL